MSMPAEDRRSEPRVWTVLWTRGKGCSELAELLGHRAERVSGDLVEVCLEHRPDLLVSRKFPSLDLVPVAVPRDLEAKQVAGVVAAVGGGPHSALAARLAARLAAALGVGARLVSAYRTEEERAGAHAALEAAREVVPHLEGEAVEADTPAEIVARLPKGSLLVFGAPGGSLVQRMFLGPGARLRAGAPAGAVMVREATPRAFHRMTTSPYVSPHLLVADARRLVQGGEAVPVVEEGRLVGMLRPADLAGGDGERPVAEVMRDPVSVPYDALLEEAAGHLDGEGPLPVVDGEQRLIGALRREDLG